MDFAHFEPCFLIAMPELSDPNFHKAVVLLSHYDQDGAIGFVINQKTDLVLGKCLKLGNSQSLRAEYQDLPLHRGGPVEQQRIWIVYDGKNGAIDNGVALGSGVRLAQNIDVLIDPKTAPLSTLRVFHGYAGWGKHQLDQEIAVSAWITAPLTADLLFHTPEEKIWDVAVKSLGINADKLVGPASSSLN